METSLDGAPPETGYGSSYMNRKPKPTTTASGAQAAVERIGTHKTVMSGIRTWLSGKKT